MNILLIFLIFLAIFFHFCEAFPQDIHKFIEQNAYLCTIDDENVRFLLEKEAKDALCNEICGQDEIKACAKNLKNDEIFCQDVSETCLQEFNLEFNTDFHTTQFPDLELPTAMALVQATNLPFNEEEAVSALASLNSHYPAPQPPEISVNQANSHQNGVFENSTSSSLQNIDNSDLAMTTPETIEPVTIIFPSLGNISGNEDASEKSNSYSARPINFKEVDERGITPQPEQTTEPFQSDLLPAPPSVTPPDDITANSPPEPYITIIAPNPPTLPEAYPSNNIQIFPISPAIIDYNQPQIQTMPSEYTQEMSDQTETFLYTATTIPCIHPTDGITPVSGYKIPEIRISFENLPLGVSKSASNYENGYPTTLPMTKNSEEAIAPVPPRELYPRNFNIGLWINPIFGEIPEEEMHYLSRSKRPEVYRPRENVRPYETSGEKYENPTKKLEEISGETNSATSYDKNSHKQPASAEEYEERESPTNYEKYPSAEKYEVSQRPKNFGRQPDGAEEGRDQNYPYHRYPGYRFFPYGLYKPYGPYSSWERPRWNFGDSVRSYLRRKEPKKEKPSEGSKNLENTEEKRNPSSKEVSQTEKSCQDLNYMCPLVVLSDGCDSKTQKMCTKRCDMCKEKSEFS